MKSDLIFEKIAIEDKIQIDIKLKDFESVNIISYDRKCINVYGVRVDELEYLNVSAYNREFKRDRNSISIYIMLGVSFFIFGNGLKLWHRNLAT